MAEWVSGLGLVLEEGATTSEDSLTDTVQNLCVRAAKPCGAHTSASGLDLAREGLDEALNELNMYGPWIFTESKTADIPLVLDQVEYALGISVFSVQEVYLLDIEEDDKQAGILFHIPYQQAGYVIPDRTEEGDRPSHWMGQNIFQNATIEIWPRPTQVAVDRWKLQAVLRSRITAPSSDNQTITAPRELANALLNYMRYHVAMHRKPDTNLPALFLSRFNTNVRNLRSVNEKQTQGHVRMTVARGYRG